MQYLLDQPPDAPREEPVGPVPQNLKDAEFRYYLVKSGALEELVKVVLALEECETWPEDPLGVFYEYLGIERVDWEAVIADTEGLRRGNEEKEMQMLKLEQRWQWTQLALAGQMQTLDQLYAPLHDAILELSQVADKMPEPKSKDPPILRNWAIKDLGCGSGALCLKMAAVAGSSQLVGIDHVASVVSAANSRELPDNLKFECADVAQLQVEPVDMLTCCQLFGCACSPSLTQLLPLFLSALKPAGGLVLSCFAPLPQVVVSEAAEEEGGTPLLLLDLPALAIDVYQHMSLSAVDDRLLGGQQITAEMLTQQLTNIGFERVEVTTRRFSLLPAEQEQPEDWTDTVSQLMHSLPPWGGVQLSLEQRLQSETILRQHTAQLQQGKVCYQVLLAVAYKPAPPEVEGEEAATQ